MNVVNQFKNSIAWYQPTTDTDDWLYFNQYCYSIDYANGTPETLKEVAWNMLKLDPGEDIGMWENLQQNFDKFLHGNIAIGDFDSVMALAIQYEFIACFRNNYAQASHNNDLWQSFNDNAMAELENPLPTSMGDFTTDIPEFISPKWLIPAVAAIIYGAFKTIEISFYRPTEDTDTWAYFQNVALNCTLLDKVYITYDQTYLLRNISSTADAGMWATLNQGVRAFLDANLGALPATAKTQVQLAINFCNLFRFNYSRAAHNQDLFKAYNDSFANATTKLQLLLN